MQCGMTALPTINPHFFRLSRPHGYENHRNGYDCVQTVAEAAGTAVVKGAQIAGTAALKGAVATGRAIRNASRNVDSASCLKVMLFCLLFFTVCAAAAVAGNQTQMGPVFKVLTQHPWQFQADRTD